jgi:glycosyltransferase involved in cell wall biosynthesis
VRPSRLLFFLTSPVRGGVEEVVLALLARLDRREFRVGLACPPTLLEAMETDLQTLEVDCFPITADSFTKPVGLAALASCIRQFRPDVVNPHLFRSAFVATPVARWLGVPYVVETYHGREAWRQGRITGSFLVDRMVSRWEDRIIAVSEAARNFLIMGKGIVAEKVVVVPNGRDLSVFKPGQGGAEIRKEFGIEPQWPVIGVVGRLEMQKGHRFLLEALPRVAAEFPQLRVLLVGDGGMKGELQTQAQRLDLTTHLIFAGFRTDIPTLLDAMDITVLPSLYEGMPLTAIEASAMAKPIIATSVDGTPEVIENGVTGLLVPPATPEALAEAIGILLRDPERARGMGAAGRKHVFARFDLGAQVEATARVYRDVVRRG